jgi:replicative DNA helicase
MDISAIVLNKLLGSQDLESFSRVKLSFLDPAYSSIFSAVNRHYEKYSTVPSFEDLEMTLREGQTKNTLEAVKLTDATEVTIDVAIDALIDQYTQNEAIRLLDRFVDKLATYDTTEIKDNLAGIVLALDEKTLSTEGIDTMDSFMFFQEEEEVSRNRVMLGINNTFDAALNGVAKAEYVMIGGPRGSGKSIIVNNIFTNQYEQGNSSVFFSIEMKGRETLERSMSILANVNYQDLKHNKLSPEDLLKVIKVRAGMFVDAGDIVEDFCKHRDRFKFEQQLVRTKELKPDNQMIVIHDRALTLTSIDIHLGKLKAKFGDKLTTCIVDYVNQVKVEGNSNKFSQFDWQPQVVVSTGLKNLADKYDLVMVSPYQIDASGEARFGKGILDPADIALVMEVHDKSTGAIGMGTTKIRGAIEQVFTSGIDWNSLRISPVPVERPQKKEKSTKEKKSVDKSSEAATDVPWGT